MRYALNAKGCGAGHGVQRSDALHGQPRFRYAPVVSGAPRTAVLQSLRAGQTGLALFFVLRLGLRERLPAGAGNAGTPCWPVRPQGTAVHCVSRTRP